MKNLVGTEKQIVLAKEIREVIVAGAKALLEERIQDHEERGKKRTLRLLNEQKEVVEKFEIEESSKYFIDNFAYILKCMNDYKMESKLREVSLDLIIGYEVKERIERI